ncbi:MAG: hypothetical protein H8Z69_03650 [Nanohaloarchaea archaeon]|nr:hypothetical protein [Candidatus Nanohaloarchaea archaeon]
MLSTLESRYAFEDYLETDADHSLPIGTEIDIYIDLDNIYGEADYALESDNTELQVMTDYNRAVVYVDEDVELSEEDELVLDHAERVLSPGGRESVFKWADRITEDKQLVSASPSDYAKVD